MVKELHLNSDFDDRNKLIENAIVIAYAILMTEINL